MEVVFIGYGNMGKTYVNSFISSRFIKSMDIFAFVKEESISSQSEEVKRFLTKIKLQNHPLF